ncbi:MAG: PQQ-dependent sugar dehydrogenase [Xanthobacteraceae bacterium]|nr:PQQ-dependent sugar dehydrogenase [Xanthobacteraceae bacterium]
MLVTERPGRLRVVGKDGELSEPLAGVPKVFAEGQGGLLDVAVAPDFAQTGRSISATRSRAGTRPEPRWRGAHDRGWTGSERGGDLPPDAQGGRFEAFRRASPSRDGRLFVTLGER